MFIRPYFPDICVDVDISRQVFGISIVSITFVLGEHSSYGVKLYIKDKVFYDIIFCYLL